MRLLIVSDSITCVKEITDLTSDWPFLLGTKS